jgi:hypothetical protein
MASRHYTRRKKGGDKWNCSCTLASSPSTNTVVSVPVKQNVAATKLQSVVRKRQAAQKLKSLKSTVPSGTPASLKSALATQSAAMPAQQKGMQALMSKPGMTEAKAKPILSRQSKKKEIAQKIKSRKVGTSTTGAKRQTKKTLKKATKAQKKKSAKGGKKNAKVAKLVKVVKLVD